MWSLLTGAFSSVGGLLMLLAVCGSLVGLGSCEMHKIDEGKYQALVASTATAAARAAATAAAMQKANDQDALNASAAEAEAQKELNDVAQANQAVPLAAPIVKTIAANCVPYGFVRLHDAAARSLSFASVGIAPGKSDDACAPVKWADVERVIVANYSLANDNAEQLNRLIATLRAEQKDMAK